MAGASLAVAIIGNALAQARGLVTKHAVKQVDRLLSNQGINVWEMFKLWIPEMIGERTKIVIAMDWTDFDADGQATLALNMVTSHGRATPLLWLSVWKEELKDQRNDFEDTCLGRLAELVPDGVHVTILADRGFGDAKLFELLEKLGFSYVIRIRGNIYVTAPSGEKRKAESWIGKGGRARKLRNASVTSMLHQVGAVVCVHAKRMKDSWCLVASNGEMTASQIIKLYSKRWTIEPQFRDTKDLKFGLGLDSVRVTTPERRDRLLLISAFAVVLLTVLGAAGESLGMDRQLKVNTTKRRTHSLFRQGCMLYDLIPMMPEERLIPLLKRYAEYLHQIRAFSETFSII